MTTKRQSLKRWRAGVLALAGACASLAASAWEPSKPIEFVVPAGTGGGADQMARFIQGVAAKNNLTKQPIVVVNKSGGAGAEGFLDVKNDKGNPHKIIITLSNLFTTPLATGVSDASDGFSRPTDAQAEQWARIVTAADDPASVLERAAAGQVSMDEIDTVRNVYPRLYQEAQQHLLEAIVGGATIPYQRRIQLGALFGLPLVATEDRAFLSSMQAGYDQPPPDAPQPRPSANVDLSSAAFLQEQNP